MSEGQTQPPADVNELLVAYRLRVADSNVDPNNALLFCIGDTDHLGSRANFGQFIAAVGRIGLTLIEGPPNESGPSFGVASDTTLESWDDVPKLMVLWLAADRLRRIEELREQIKNDPQAMLEGRLMEVLFGVRPKVNRLLDAFVALGNWTMSTSSERDSNLQANLERHLYNEGLTGLAAVAGDGHFSRGIIDWLKRAGIPFVHLVPDEEEPEDSAEVTGAIRDYYSLTDEERLTVKQDLLVLQAAEAEKAARDV